jgi:hypothetical protein
VKQNYNCIRGTIQFTFLQIVYGSWLQIQRSGVLFPALQDFLCNSGSGTGPLSLVSIFELLLERRSSDAGLENRDYDRRGFAALTTQRSSIRKS